MVKTLNEMLVVYMHYTHWNQRE